MTDKKHILMNKNLIQRNDDIFHIVAEIKIKGYGCESGIPLFIPEVI